MTKAAEEKGGGKFEGIKLALCENPLPPIPEAVSAAAGELEKSNRYTEPYSPELRKEISKYAKAPEELIHINAGSELILRQIFELFGSRPHLIVPTYSLFEEISKSKTCTYLREEEGFRFDLANLKVPEKTTIVTIVNVNNPTGGVFDIRDSLHLLDDNPETFFLVDEAFIEFGGRPVSDLVEDYDNLIVTRTFSKGFSLAGFRVGYAILPEKWANHFNMGNDAYPIARPGEAAAIASLRNIDRIRERVKRLKGWAQGLSAELEELGIKTYPSEGYFFLARLPVNAEKFASEMLRNGVMVKPLKQAGLEGDFVKFVTSAPEKDRVVVETVKKILGS
ncbi:aminotransferase class I/II-fold pyridoxal phosphate-dependent enzyme [Candidatus Micrarchaeota archaeon]|nr:aminotransferase class I/II-fold pyridoxal phosphate-dependent enzyme [Candidatus Micrarchaeota archaeon]